MKEQIERLLVEFGPNGRSREERAALVLPLLRLVQHEFGHIPTAALKPIARFAGVSESDVYGVASFYAHFSFTPVGKNVITLCRGTACHVRGSGSLLDDVQQKLGIASGETSADGQFTLQTVACFGSCALAPIVVINGQVYGRMTRARLLKMIDTLAEETAAGDRQAAVEATR